jgi:hypothetical protein
MMFQSSQVGPTSITHRITSHFFAFHQIWNATLHSFFALPLLCTLFTNKLNTIHCLETIRSSNNALIDAPDQTPKLRIAQLLVKTAPCMLVCVCVCVCACARLLAKQRIALLRLSQIFAVVLNTITHVYRRCLRRIVIHLAVCMRSDIVMIVMVTARRYKELKS